MKSRGIRPRFCKLGGVNVKNPKETFIGNNVSFDTNYPEKITIERGAWITTGCIILTHYRNQEKKRFDVGNVLIKKNAFLGCNTIITKPIIIGENSIVGAGSVVTKNIPDNEVWAGNPARYIRSLSILENNSN